MKTYYARTFGPVSVIEGQSRRPLLMRRDLRRFSEGFAWGTNWPACDQLSLAILCDVYDDEKALRFYQQFNTAVIARQNRDAPLRLTLPQVIEAVEGLEARIRL